IRGSSLLLGSAGSLKIRTNRSATRWPAKTWVGKGWLPRTPFHTSQALSFPHEGSKRCIWPEADEGCVLPAADAGDAAANRQATATANRAMKRAAPMAPRFGFRMTAGMAAPGKRLAKSESEL